MLVVNTGLCSPLTGVCFFYVLLFVLLTQPWNEAHAETAVLLDGDGAVTGSFPMNGVLERMTFRFDLPRLPAAKAWQEGEAQRTLWVTNGIRYTQTLLFSECHSESGPVPVLLVNIEGDNTNSEYKEAFANLTIEIAGKREQLELRDGGIWLVRGDTKLLLAALAIPDSGIRVAHGETLRFSGNIPPSLKGSMTLKVPLGLFSPGTQAIALVDLDFEEEFRKLRKAVARKLHPEIIRQATGGRQTPEEPANTRP